MKRVFLVARENLKNAYITILGDMLGYYIEDGLYITGLSGNSLQYNERLLDFFSTTKSISAYYPAFSGTPVKYEVSDNKQIRCKLPEDLVDGDYDFIFCNPAGYTKASKLKTFEKLSIVPLSSI